jgi:hypothetical protein
MASPKTLDYASLLKILKKDLFDYTPSLVDNTPSPINKKFKKMKYTYYLNKN